MIDRMGPLSERQSILPRFQRDMGPLSERQSILPRFQRDMGPLSERQSILPRFQRDMGPLSERQNMGRETSIFLLYVCVMLIFAFMLRSLLSSPHYYGILLMLGILVFIIIYPVPNIYSAAQYSIVNRPMHDRFDQLEWNNEKQSEKPTEPTMPIVPKPLIISTH